MSDQTINQPRPSLKSINARVEKLGSKIDELDILVYHHKRLSAAYKQLAETLDHIDIVTFEIRQELDQIREICRGGDCS